VAKVVLVTGGCRSGKSLYAQQLAESLPLPRLYVATCPVTDDEMLRRIEAHRQARANRGWETIEEQVDLAGVIRAHAQHAVLLVDCVTLWVNNLMYQAQREGRPMHEAAISHACRDVLDAAEGVGGTVIFVTNEVGMGIVPENASAREFRDLVGRANQSIAARADSVTLLVSGIPVPILTRSASESPNTNPKRQRGSQY